MLTEERSCEPTPNELTRTSGPRGAPEALNRRTTMSGPPRVQVTTKLPASSIATAGRTAIGLKLLIRNSPPTGSPDALNSLARIPGVGGPVLSHTTTNDPDEFIAIAGRRLGVKAVGSTRTSPPRGRPSGS